MCFSAEASFGASIIISTIGIVSYKKANKTPFRLLAVIPLFFGFQQFLEGIVWLGLSHASIAPFLSLSTYGFIIFAWVLWPTYIPFSLWKLEQNQVRKKILLALMVIGISTSLVLLYVMLSRPIHAKIMDCSIFYDFSARHPLSILISISYLSSTVLPTFVSGVRKMWVFGVLNILTYYITKVYFYEQNISVWCFIAAIISILMLWIVQENVAKKRA